jgi:hypothetical protein
MVIQNLRAITKAHFYKHRLYYKMSPRMKKWRQVGGVEEG